MLNARVSESLECRAESSHDRATPIAALNSRRVVRWQIEDVVAIFSAMLTHTSEQATRARSTTTGWRASAPPLLERHGLRSWLLERQDRDQQQQQGSLTHPRLEHAPCLLACMCVVDVLMLGQQHRQRLGAKPTSQQDTNKVLLLGSLSCSVVRSALSVATC